MDQLEFKRRTRQIGVAAIRLADQLPPQRAADILAGQLICFATSIGANYRAACQARSPQEMFAKLSIVEEEADESLYWLELLEMAGAGDSASRGPLRPETSEILAMVVSSRKTLKARFGSNSFEGNTLPNRES